MSALRIATVCALSILFFGGCAGLDVREDEIFIQEDLPEPERMGIYHKVNPGETVWRIAQTYGVSLEDIIRTNNIPDVAQVEENQLIFIPGVQAVKNVPVETDENPQDFEWPIKGAIQTYFHQVKNGHRVQGIDIEAREGDLVKAARRGKVVLADFLTGYGNTVIIDHQDGLMSVYARNGHMLVDVGSSVWKGMDIAHVGKEGRDVYLHFQIRKDQREQNPLYYLPKP